MLHANKLISYGCVVLVVGYAYDRAHAHGGDPGGYDHGDDGDAHDRGRGRGYARGHDRDCVHGRAHDRDHGGDAHARGYAHAHDDAHGGDARDHGVLGTSPSTGRCCRRSRAARSVGSANRACRRRNRSNARSLAASPTRTRPPARQ